MQTFFAKEIVRLTLTNKDFTVVVVLKKLILYLSANLSVFPCLDAIQKEVQNALRKNFVPNNPLMEG